MTRPISTRLVIGGVAALTAALLAACSGGDTTSATGTASNAQLVFGNDTPPPTLDPIQASQVQVDSIAVATYEPLVDYTSDSTLAGVLASKWSVSDDATSIAFTLNDKAAFHDGAPVTAADVKYTLDRIKKLGLGVAESLAAYESTEVSSDTEFTIKLSEPSALFIGSLSRVYILNSQLVEKNAGSDNGQTWLATHEAGSGPYTLASYKTNTEAVMNRWKDYWDFDPKTAEKVIYRYITGSSTQKDEMLRGTIQIADGLDPEDIEALDKTGKFKTTVLEKPQGTYVFFNTQAGLTKDIRIRKAISLAYDYVGATQAILKDGGSPMTSLLPNTMPCRLEKDPVTDLDEAKKLVEEAGATGKTVTMAYQTFASEFQLTATALQSDLKKIGLNLKLQVVQYPAYIKSLAKTSTTPEMALLWDNPPMPDAGSVLLRSYTSSSVGSSTNFAQYSNPEVDDVLAKAAAESDVDAQCDDYKKAQELIAADYPAMPIADHTYPIVSPKNVSGIEFRPAHVTYVPQAYKVD